MRALIWVFFVGACGAAEPAVRIETSENDRSRSEADDVAAFPVVPDTWADVAPRIVATYVGRLEARRGATEYDMSFCEIPERIVGGGAEGAALPGAWCGPEDQPPFGHGWAEAPGVNAFILTEMRDGRERPFFVWPCETDCSELPRQALVRELRCRGFQDLQTGGRPEHQACSADSDCVVLSAMCFDAVVSTSHAASYQSAMDRYWGECLPAGGGMCPPHALIPRCAEGLCTVVAGPGR